MENTNLNLQRNERNLQQQSMAKIRVQGLKTKVHIHKILSTAINNYGASKNYYKKIYMAVFMEITYIIE